MTKGDVHTESGGQPIGLEVRAQAFAFSSNNEINNMTFYNYTVINQGVPDLDRYLLRPLRGPGPGLCQRRFRRVAMCSRGFGFAYNWDDNDDNNCKGAIGYGASPPLQLWGSTSSRDPTRIPITWTTPVRRTTTRSSIVKRPSNRTAFRTKGIGIGYGDGLVTTSASVCVRISTGTGRASNYDRPEPGRPLLQIPEEHLEERCP